MSRPHYTPLIAPSLARPSSSRASCPSESVPTVTVTESGRCPTGQRNRNRDSMSQAVEPHSRPPEGFSKGDYGGGGPGRPPFCRTLVGPVERCAQNRPKICFFRSSKAHSSGTPCFLWYKAYRFNPPPIPSTVCFYCRRGSIPFSRRILLIPTLTQIRGVQNHCGRFSMPLR